MTFFKCLWLPKATLKGIDLDANQVVGILREKVAIFFSSHFIFQIVVTRAKSTFNETKMTIISEDL